MMPNEEHPAALQSGEAQREDEQNKSLPVPEQKQAQVAPPQVIALDVRNVAGEPQVITIDVRAAGYTDDLGPPSHPTTEADLIQRIKRSRVNSGRVAGFGP
jgi:hypothetical protein